MFESWDDNSGLFGVEVFVGGSTPTRDSENESMWVTLTDGATIFRFPCFRR